MSEGLERHDCRCSQATSAASSPRAPFDARWCSLHAMNELVRATNVEEAFDALDPFALIKPSHPFFADIEADLPREHYGVTDELKRHFRSIQTRRRWQHLGLVGHKGTGKTTLVRKAMSELRDKGVMAVQINTQLAVDQGGFTFTDMIL